MQRAMQRGAGRELTMRFGGVSVGSGLARSPDGREMYRADSRSNVVEAFAFEPGSGEPSRRRGFLRQVHLPLRCPTKPAFGGHDAEATTARHRRPAAGCVFALDVDLPGLPLNFARP
jgi:sugar lactone lactonase YvrE